MKALSLRQPWGWFVVYADKRIENRPWNTRYRGELLIHAALGMTRDEYEQGVAFARRAGFLGPVPPMKSLERGGVIAIAKLVDVIPPGEALRKEPPPKGYNMKWWTSQQFGFLLADVRPLPFIACRGALGLFEIPPRVESRVTEALGWEA